MTIWCVGRNYAEHAKEMKAEVPKAPLIFLKPESALTGDGALRLPPDSRRVDHEVELVVRHGRSPAMAVGIDFTARDLQEEAKKKGLPWTSSKGRPGFAAVGNFVPLALPAVLELTVGGKTRQKASTAEMIFPVPALLAHLEEVYGLREGDLIFTGTPSGVGPVAAGDVLEASLGASRLRLTVV